MKKNPKTIYFVVIIVFVIILLPFVTNLFLSLADRLGMFNSENHFSKELWFSFFGSYFGAIGTVFLGFIALYQNKKYRDLADKTDKKNEETISEIQKLTEKTVSLMSDLNSIKQATYYPDILVYPEVEIKTPSDALEKEQLNPVPFLFVIYNNSGLSGKSSKDIFNEFYSLSIKIKNIGEKKISNFKTDSYSKDNNLYSELVCRPSHISIGSNDVFKIILLSKNRFDEPDKESKICISSSYNNIVGDTFEKDIIVYIEGESSGFCEID